MFLSPKFHRWARLSYIFYGITHHSKFRFKCIYLTVLIHTGSADTGRSEGKVNTHIAAYKFLTLCFPANQLVTMLPWVFCLFATERVLIWCRLSVKRCQSNLKPLPYLKTVRLHFGIAIALIILRTTTDPHLTSVGHVAYWCNCGVKINVIFNNYWLQLIKNNVNNLLLASRLILNRSRRLRQMIDLRDIDKSRDWFDAKFSNGFIIRFQVCIHI